MPAILISCDNATCAVPEAYREVFRGAEDVVASTEGWEPGALNLGQAFAMKFRTPLVHGDVTRLLIDLEQEGEARWSRFSLKLPEATRARVADRHETPYRTTLRQRINEDLRRHAAVVHVRVHTDPATDGRVVLETPPGADSAANLAAAWARPLRMTELDVRQYGNVEPSVFAAMLGREYPPAHYVQVRLSVSQSFFLEGRPWRWEVVKKLLLDTLVQTMAALPASGLTGSATAPR